MGTMQRLIECQVYGERNSGTTYVQKLIDRNLHVPVVSADRGFGWKHGPLGVPFEVHSPEGDVTADGFRDYRTDSGQALFLVVYREPFSWMQSMHRAPHHAPTVYQLPFAEFLRTRWQSHWGWPGVDLDPDPKERMRMVRDASLFEDHANIVALRIAKTALFEEFVSKLEHVAYVNYEVIRDRPRDVLRAISNVFAMPYDDAAFVAETTDKYGRPGFQPWQYPDYDPADEQFVREHLDWEQETRIGYGPLRTSAKAPLRFDTVLRYSVPGAAGRLTWADLGTTAPEP